MRLGADARPFHFPRNRSCSLFLPGPIFGFNDKYVYVLHVVRGHWTVTQMHDRIKALALEWKVNQILDRRYSKWHGTYSNIKAGPLALGDRSTI